jgi:formate hydrogenlyase subunit 4
MNFLFDLVAQGVQMLLVLALSPLVIGFTRKLKARLLRRKGPPIIQPWRDLIRLLRKEVVLAENASWLYRSAPYMIFAMTWVAASLVPTFATGLMFSWSADLIAIIALLGSARFFLALAGMDVGTAFGGMGSSREMTISSLAEPAMLLAVFTLAMTVASTNLSTVIAHLATAPLQLYPSFIFAALAMVLVAIAETGRIPIDNPATHLELTMTHEAMILEYSSRHLALMEWASMMKLFLYGVLLANLFIPWGVGQTFTLQAIAWGLTAITCKLFVLGIMLAIAETGLAKMRLFRVPKYLSLAFILSLIGLLSHVILER